jgi:hypothetical protein
MHDFDIVCANTCKFGDLSQIIDLPTGDARIIPVVMNPRQNLEAFSMVMLGEANGCHDYPEVRM